MLVLWKHYKCSRDRPISLFLKPTQIFSILFLTDIWPSADIRLATDTDIPKFVYRYFNEVFRLKLTRIAYSLNLQQPN